MREKNAFVYREPLASAGNKAERALGFAARASAGAVWLPKGQPWADRLINQLCAFSGRDGRTDDMVDVCSLLGRGLDSMTNARPAPAKAKPPAYGTFDYMEYSDRQKERQQNEQTALYR